MLRDSSIDTPGSGREAALTRRDIEVLMAKFLRGKRRKIEKVKPGVSGFNQGKMESDWGYSGGFR